MIVDLRSDTITKPTPEMYEAMAEAELGDDVLGDDPTVIALEKLAAERVGKEDAVFVPSGTMGNQLGVAIWTKPGDGMILEQESHIIYNESGAVAAHFGVVLWSVPSHLAVMDPNDVRARVTVGTMHTPPTRLLCLENSNNRSGGATIPIEMMREYRAIADDAGMRIHLDGARLFNAAAYLRVTAAEVAKYADSVMFCVSKGLSCPVGSLLCGPKEDISRARHLRKRLGGGMRQAGLLAACGIYALNHLTERVLDDHRRARAFAEHVSGMRGLCVDLESVQTNIVRVGTEEPAADWQRMLHESGVRVLMQGPNRIRFVFHREIDDEKLEFAKRVVSDLTAKMAS